mmetsp:Transcript_26702/g.85798  ORF Transcript_26702/g.85798 Transcript_26702/m.85798 type:complete len:211 (-) Transcript_26702:343-975(-)
MRRDVRGDRLCVGLLFLPLCAVLVVQSRAGRVARWLAHHRRDVVGHSRRAEAAGLPWRMRVQATTTAHCGMGAPLCCVACRRDPAAQVARTRSHPTPDAARLPPARGRGATRRRLHRRPRELPRGARGAPLARRAASRRRVCYLRPPSHRCRGGGGAHRRVVARLAVLVAHRARRRSRSRRRARGGGEGAHKHGRHRRRPAVQAGACSCG